MKMARKGLPTHGRSGGEFVDSVRGGQMFAQVVEQAIDMGILGGDGNRLFNELCLPTFPMRRNHHYAGNLVGDLRAVILAHQEQAAIQASGRARRGHQPILLNVERIGVQLDLWESGSEVLLSNPVR